MSGEPTLFQPGGKVTPDPETAKRLEELRAKVVVPRSARLHADIIQPRKPSADQQRLPNLLRKQAG